MKFFVFEVTKPEKKEEEDVEYYVFKVEVNDKITFSSTTAARKWNFLL